jgi:hypothetical protein
MDESILSLPFLRPGVLVQCSNCGEKAADVYAESEEAALAGRGVCNKCAATVVVPPPVAPVEATEAPAARRRKKQPKLE